MPKSLAEVAFFSKLLTEAEGVRRSRSGQQFRQERPLRALFGQALTTEADPEGVEADAYPAGASGQAGPGP